MPVHRRRGERSVLTGSDRRCCRPVEDLMRGNLTRSTRSGPRSRPAPPGRAMPHHPVGQARSRLGSASRRRRRRTPAAPGRADEAVRREAGEARRGSRPSARPRSSRTAAWRRSSSRTRSTRTSGTGPPGARGRPRRTRADVPSWRGSRGQLGGRAHVPLEHVEDLPPRPRRASSAGRGDAATRSRGSGGVAWDARPRPPPPATRRPARRRGRGSAR